MRKVPQNFDYVSQLPAMCISIINCIIKISHNIRNSSSSLLCLHFEQSSNLLLHLFERLYLISVLAHFDFTYPGFRSFHRHIARYLQFSLHSDLNLKWKSPLSNSTINTVFAYFDLFLS